MDKKVCFSSATKEKEYKMSQFEIFAEIDLKKIESNIKNLKKLAGNQTDLMAVVKADAYGHGAVKIAETAIKSNAEFLGTARIEEALELRANNINSKILTLAYPGSDFIKNAADEKIDIAVHDFDSAKMISSHALENNREINIHIKVDTGMGRLAVHGSEDEIINQIKKIISLKNINPVGLFTHFATADEKDLEYAHFQMNKFSSIQKKLSNEKINFKYYHCANSAGLINIPESRKSLVRPGIAVYGLYPSQETDRNKIELFPAMTLKAKILKVKEVDKDFNVSYGKTWKTNKKSKLATIAMGYGDGFPRSLSSNTHVLINGEKAPIRGRICMDLCIADVTGIHNVVPGTYATIIGSDGDKHISADYHAKKADTINYEIVTALTKRVKRIYKN